MTSRGSHEHVVGLPQLCSHLAGSFAGEQFEPAPIGVRHRKWKCHWPAIWSDIWSPLNVNANKSANHYPGGGLQLPWNDRAFGGHNQQRVNNNIVETVAVDSGYNLWIIIFQRSLRSCLDISHSGRRDLPPNTRSWRTLLHPGELMFPHKYSGTDIWWVL